MPQFKTSLHQNIPRFVVTLCRTLEHQTKYQYFHRRSAAIQDFITSRHTSLRSDFKASNKTSVLSPPQRRNSRLHYIKTYLASS
jgi:hypothetical protein